MHIYRAEKIWLIFAAGMMAVFLAVITVGALFDGLVPPSRIETIDPTKVSQTPPFNKPGLREVARGVYEAYYVAHVFAFDPAAITVPAGSRVTFYVTSADVMHGFSIPETGVYVAVEPGWVSSVAHTFKTPGTFLLICNEYCGGGHQLMASEVDVQ